MRLRLLCAIATMLPMAMESTASTTNIWLQSGCEPARASGSKRMARANAASFDAVPMKTVTQVGDPSYTSGINFGTGSGDGYELEVPLPSIDDRHAVQKCSGCHRSQDEILDCGLGCDARFAV